jgi:hypothetical protein
MRCILAIATALMLTSCTGSTLGQASQNPGEILCKGKAVLSIIGSAGPSSGLNGSITADCGPDGASIQWGPPSTPAVSAERTASP